MRPGGSCIPKRFSKANNKSMKFYYHKTPSKLIMYLDGNNTYRSAMIKYLPIVNLND